MKLDEDRIDRISVQQYFSLVVFSRTYPRDDFFSVSVLRSSVWRLFGARGRPFTLLLHPRRLLVFVEIPPSCSTTLQQVKRPKMGTPNRGNAIAQLDIDPVINAPKPYTGFEIKR